MMQAQGKGAISKIKCSITLIKTIPSCVKTTHDELCPLNYKLQITVLIERDNH